MNSRIRIGSAMLFGLVIGVSSETAAQMPVNVTIDRVRFAPTFGGSAFRTIEVAGQGLQAWNVRSTIWDFAFGVHSGPRSNTVVGGRCKNTIEYGGPGDYPTGVYTAGSVIEGAGNPPWGKNAANLEFIIIDAVGGGKSIVIPGAGGPPGGGG